MHHALDTFLSPRLNADLDSDGLCPSLHPLASHNGRAGAEPRLMGSAISPVRLHKIAGLCWLRHGRTASLCASLPAVSEPPLQTYNSPFSIRRAPNVEPIGVPVESPGAEVSFYVEQKPNIIASLVLAGA